MIACAERGGGRVLALDQRDFGVVAREGTIEALPRADWTIGTSLGRKVVSGIPLSIPLATVMAVHLPATIVFLRS